MEASRKFIWVYVDRDRQPELPKRFNVSAYPTLMTLGSKFEKIYRIRGYKPTPELIAELEESLRRYRLYKKGEPWDTPKARPAKVCDSGVVTTLPAPSEEIPNGMVLQGGALWVAQKFTLHRLDPESCKVVKTFGLTGSPADLATDGTSLYVLHYGWTAGKPIQVVDPSTGNVVREIVTEANLGTKSWGARGLAFRDGKLFVLEGMKGLIREIDPKTGKETRRIQTEERWTAGLAVDGKRFVLGGRTHLAWVDQETGKTVNKVPVNYRLRSVASHDGRLYLMEQPIFGYDTENKRIRVWPKKTSIHRLQLGEEK